MTKRCWACKAEMPADAWKCRHCGETNHQPYVKVLTALVVVAVLVWLFWGWL